MKPLGPLVLAAVLGCPLPAIAHDQPYSFIDLRLDSDSLHATVSAHVADLAHEIGIAAPESLLERSAAERHAAPMRALLDSRLRILAGGRPLRMSWGEPRVRAQRSLVTFEAAAPWTGLPGRLRVDARLFPYDPQHETYLNIYEGAAIRRQDLLGRSREAADHYTGGGAGEWAVLRTFVAAGVHQIFIGPDHVLFVIGLLLLGGSVRRLLKIVTAFTLAHSVTLALATLRLVNPPAAVIEPAIALSIVFVGADNPLAARRGRDGRVWIAFGFGLVHGFGFASVLRDFGLPERSLGISLFSFNAGVEAGQVCIVLAVAPLLALARARGEEWAARIAAVGSSCIIVAGAVWLVERTLFAA